MTGPEAATRASAAERLVPAVVTTDTGPGLIEAPLRPSNWIGFVGSWVLLSAGVVWTFTSGMQIMGVGGFCAEGGPYEIATHCPADAAAFLNLGFMAAASGVLLGVFGARGFGVPAHGFAWSLLFGVMGIAFLISSFAAPVVSVAWLICGILFVAVAVPPALMIRMGWPRSIFGRRRLDGRSLVTAGLPVRDAVWIGLTWLGAGAVSGWGAVLLVWLTL